jgi:hypothetical protein
MIGIPNSAETCLMFATTTLRSMNRSGPAQGAMQLARPRLFLFWILQSIVEKTAGCAELIDSIGAVTSVTEHTATFAQKPLPPATPMAQLNSPARMSCAAVAIFSKRFTLFDSSIFSKNNNDFGERFFG